MEDQENENEFQREENTNDTENEAEQGPLDPTTVMTNTEYIPSSSIPVENVSYCCCYIFMCVCVHSTHCMCLVQCYTKA